MKLLHVLSPQSMRSWWRHFALEDDEAIFIGTDPTPQSLRERLAHHSDRMVWLHSSHETLVRDAALADALKPSVTALLASGARAARLGADKFAMRSFFDERGIDTPRWQPGPCVAPAHGLAKSRHGSQSQGLRAVVEGERVGEDEYWEAWCEGEEYSVVCYVDRTDFAVFPPIWKGRTQSDLTPPWRRLRRCPAPGLSASESERLQQIALEIVRCSGCLGLAEVEFVLGEDGPLVLEINPRLSGTVRISALATRIPILSLPRIDVRGLLAPVQLAAESPWAGEPFSDPVNQVFATSRITVAGPTRRAVDRALGIAPRTPRDAPHASRAKLTSSVLEFLNEAAVAYPDALSLAAGKPPAEDVPPSGWAHALTAGVELLEGSADLPQITSTRGRLCAGIAEHLHQTEALDVPPWAIVETSGCQEGLLLSMRALCRSTQDVVLVPEPTYPGVLAAARFLGLELVAIPEGPRGLTSQDVARCIREVERSSKRARALYICPDAANPTGTVVPLEERQRLVELTAAADVALLEDTAYRGLEPGPALPTLYALDPHSVVLLGSVSKTLMPSARFGYAISEIHTARGLLIEAIASARTAVTLSPSALTETTVAGLWGAGLGTGTALRRRADTVASRRRALLNALESAFTHSPCPGVVWREPQAGFFVCVDVPFEANMDALHRSARDFGVLWTPLDAFYVGDKGKQRLRLSCSASTPDEIVDATRRFAAFCQTEANRSP